MYYTREIDYEMDPKWSDVVPIPQNEGTATPLAQIAYTDEYSQAASYLRAVMADNDHSERVLNLTEHIITMNPAHYTVWLYRAETIKALGIHPHKELDWLEDISLKYLKNFQIWGYRQSIMELSPDLPPNELYFLAKILSKDAKNYHVWAYRQWLVEHFALWPTNGDKGTELTFVEGLIASDIRNNSAWNHRFYLQFNRGSGYVPAAETFTQEIEYAKNAIELAPQNAAAWNYLRGVIRRQGKGSKEIEDFALQYASVEDEAKVRSSHALDLLAEIWASELQHDKAIKALDLLSSKYDPVRANYWNYRKTAMGNAIKTV